MRMFKMDIAIGLIARFVAEITLSREWPCRVKCSERHFARFRNIKVTGAGRSLAPGGILDDAPWSRGLTCISIVRFPDNETRWGGGCQYQ